MDRLVSEGVGGNRSEVIRRSVAHYDEWLRRHRTGEAIAASYRSLPQDGDDDALAMANAVALTEAEPW